MEVFEIFRMILFRISEILKQVPLFGTNLWYILIGFAALGIVIKAYRFLFFGQGKDDKK